MKTWHSRIGVALVALGVFVGVLVVAPAPAMAASYASCSFGGWGYSGIVSANPTYHDIYWGVTIQAGGGGVDWFVIDYDSRATVGHGYVYAPDWTKPYSKSGHITNLYNRYYLALGCHAGFTSGYIS
jgi:hypothetical protein